MEQYEFKVDSISSRERLDVFLSAQQAEISRSRLKKLIIEGRVTVNGVVRPVGYKISEGDLITVQVPTPVPLDTVAEPIPLNIVFEDEYLLALDKPAGIVVHPAPGHYTGTLVNALLHHCKDLSGIGGVERPGIVHRLDKDTSGLVMVAKTESAHKNLSAQFKKREIRKEYLAIVKGNVKKDEGSIHAAIGRHKVHRKKMDTRALNGREASTEYQVVYRCQKWSYLKLWPKTGRTHQIRVHLASIHHPVIGDQHYGGKSVDLKIPRQALHAHRLELKHPITGLGLSFHAPLPQDMRVFLQSHGYDPP
ncbi:MAG: RluA family pseudouridine synthase [Nitrospinae bacterium]|nr:RluA family pseudouridine synthase [Nitrospinota bacterium]MBL7020313.1 RluA family pseudouridine synthase [Nitrospinaceae bacterium]